MLSKELKKHLMQSCLTLSIKRYGSRVSEVIQCVEAIEKGARGSLSTKIGQLTQQTCVYIYIYI